MLITFLVSVTVALFVSFLCSLMEASLLSLTPSQLADLSNKHPKIGAIWQSFKSDINRPIAAILILNTAAHTIGAAVAGAQFDDVFGQQWIWFFSLIFTFLMLQFSEILPKTLGVRFNCELALFIATPLAVAVRLFTPLIRLTHWINKPFEIGSSKSRSPATIDEITALAAFARLSNQIGKHQERIIKGASRLSQLPVRQVMLPIEHVSFLSTSQSLFDAVTTAHIDSHTRFPVCENNDHNRVVGYVNFKEMIYYMRTNPNDPSFKGIIRPVYFADPDAPASDLLKGFVDQHVHIAIVRDADGRSLGLVTFEDLVEELVGELEDEFDRLPRLFHPLSGGTWMVGGGIPMAELAQKLDLKTLNATGSLSAWLLQRVGSTPKPGQTCREAGLEFQVRRVRRGKIFEASVTRLTPA